MIESTIKTLGNLILAGGSRARLNVLYYHRVVESYDPLNDSVPDVARFRWQMGLVKRYFNVLPLWDAVQGWRNGTLPARTVCITFDDGYKDNLTLAAPILQELGLPATIFVASGYLQGRNMWNDRLIEAARTSAVPVVDLEPLGFGTHSLSNLDDRQALARTLIGHLKHHEYEKREDLTSQVCEILEVVDSPRLMLAPDDLARIEEIGFEVGGHTVNHPILRMESPERAVWEINQGRAELADILGHPVRLFAYPNGRPDDDYDASHVDIVRRAGFDAAFSTSPCIIRPDSDAMELPRFTPWDRTPERYLARMMIQGAKSWYSRESVALAAGPAEPAH